MLRFADPLLLLLLLLLPPLAWLRGRAGGGPALLFPGAGILNLLGKQRPSRARRLLAHLPLLTLALLVLTLARPQRGGSTQEIKASGIDIILLLDVSRSMLAEDFTIGGKSVNRLEAVRKVTRDFIQARPTDRIGMVAFAGQPYVVSPLTLDHDWLLRSLDRVRIGLVEDGTAIGSAIAAAAKRLQKQDETTKSRIIILLTDGSNNAGSIDPITAAEAARALGLKIYTIAAGTDGDAPFPVQDQFGRIHYQMLRGEFDEKTLNKIAEMGQGKAFRATNTEALSEVYKEIDTLEKTTYNFTYSTQYDELYPWFAIPALALLILHPLLQSTLARRTP